MGPVSSSRRRWRPSADSIGERRRAPCRAGTAQRWPLERVASGFRNSRQDTSGQSGHNRMSTCQKKNSRFSFQLKQHPLCRHFDIALKWLPRKHYFKEMKKKSGHTQHAHTKGAAVMEHTEIDNNEKETITRRLKSDLAREPPAWSARYKSYHDRKDSSETLGKLGSVRPQKKERKKEKQDMTQVAEHVIH